MLEAADLVLTATRELRSQVLAEVPAALRRTFTIVEFAALVEQAEGSTPEQLVKWAGVHRSLAANVDQDIPDPYRRGPEAHSRAAAGDRRRRAADREGARPVSHLPGVALAALGLAASLVAAPPVADSERDRAPDRASVSPARSSVSSDSTPAALPLAGVRIALDPGHQLGNHNFPREIRRLVPAGGFSKPCNTTGTATNGGYPEATLNFRIAKLVRRKLVALGADVRLTRTRNSQSLWGPCVDKRGEFGAKVHARLIVSLHADGASSGAHGFHVIAPNSRRPWTDRHRPPVSSSRQGAALGLRPPRHPAVDLHRQRHRPLDPLRPRHLEPVRRPGRDARGRQHAQRLDAHRMTTSKGRHRYARAVVRGIRLYLGA